MQQQNIISSSCKPTPTKYMHNSFSHKLLISLISLIFLSVLIEAAPIFTVPSLTDLSVLKLFANYAAATYCKVPQVKAGTQVIKEFKNERLNTKGYLAVDHENNLVVVAFRGTVPGDPTNLVTDLKFIKENYEPVPDAKVHKGFYEAFKEIQPQVTDDVLRLIQEYPTFGIGITGHSLGGALAALAALDLAQKHPELGNRNEKLFVKTFGQPRIGDEKFAEYADKNLRTLRSVVHGDPIPHLPLLSPIPIVGNFKHFGDELYINKPKEDPNAFIQCGVEDPNCSISAPISAININHHSGPYYGVNMRDYCESFSGEGGSGEGGSGEGGGGEGGGDDDDDDGDDDGDDDDDDD